MRLLFLTHRVPYAPNRGDRIRALEMLRYFKTSGISVCLVALAHEDEEVAEASRLSDLVEVLHVVRVTRFRNLLRAGLLLPTDRPLTHVLLDSPQMRHVLARVRRDWRPDLVLAFCSGMARFAMEPPLDAVPFVLDMVDVDSLKWQALAKHGNPVARLIYAREARLLKRFEVEATRAAQATLVVNDREGEALRALDSSFRPVVVELGVDLERFRNPGQPAGNPEVVFTGVFSYQPNETGARWLIQEVWPLVHERRPEARLTLVGRGPSSALGRLANRAGIEVTGAVPDVRPYLWRAAVAVAPLETARGMQNKVLEAAAAGLPSVVTPDVFEGLPRAVRPACRVAAGVEDFAREIVGLLDLDAVARRRFVAAATLHTLTWDTCLSPLREVMANALCRMEMSR